MTAEDAWLAGIIEGEGCLDIKRFKTQKPAFRIRVEMKDEDIIARVAKEMGVSYHYRASRDLYETTVTGRNAVAVYERIEPLLGERRHTKAAEIFAELG